MWGGIGGGKQMIWIRSQDREMLIKVSEFNIKQQRFGDMRKHEIWFDKSFLGVYATKERCLEVLDEIEKAIEESNIMRYEYFQGFSQQLIEYTYKGRQVYQMPKD